MSKFKYKEAAREKQKKDKIAPGEGIQREHRGITEKRWNRKH